MGDWISVAVGAVFVAVENVVLFLFGKKKGSKSVRLERRQRRKRLKNIARQEKKVAKDYQKLKVDESLLEEMKKGGDE